MILFILNTEIKNFQFPNRHAQPKRENGILINAFHQTKNRGKSKATLKF